MKYFLISVLTSLLFIITGCTKEKVEDSETYRQLTKTIWSFYLVKPGEPIVFPWDTNYSIYHIPPNVGAYGISGHSIFFKPGGSFTHSRFPTSSSTWNLDKNLQDINVSIDAGAGNLIRQVWAIEEMSDTLLKVRVRQAEEPANTENYWGYKYRRL